MAVLPEDVRLLANDPFRRLLESRAVGQIGQNALLYTLLILIVNETGSSIYSTLLVTAFILPSILLGLPAGGLADILPRRPLLVLGYLLRAVLVMGMIISTDDVWTILLLVLAFSTVGQFTGPAESASLPVLVRREQLPAGNSLFVLSVMVGQAVGAVVLAPFVLMIFGAGGSLGVAAAMFLWAAFIVSLVTGLRARAADERPQRDESGLLDALTAGWAVLRSSRQAFLALVYLTVVGTLGKALAVLAPHYTKDVLNIDTENAVFVVAPAAIGALAALLLAPLLARWFGALTVAAAGFVLFVLSIVGLGLVVLVRDFIVDNVDFGFTFIEHQVPVSSISIVTMAMILAIPVGFAATVVGVTAKAVLNQEAPEGKQGRVFATQSALSDALSLLPLFAIGGVAELVGVREVLLVAAVLAFVAGVFLTVSRRFGPPPQAQPTEAR
ncbi:MAG: MFS transporter [Dehalococcoidia bacterium]